MNRTLQSLKLALLNTGFADLDTSWNFDNVISPFSRLYYVLEGTGVVTHNNRDFELKPGYMYLIPSYTYSKYRCEDFQKQYHVSFIEEMNTNTSVYELRKFKYEIKATEIDKFYFERLLKLNPNRALINDDPEVYDNRASLLAFKEQNELLTSSEYLETKGILTILFSRFIKSEVKKQVSEEERLIGFREVLKYINENLHQDISIKKLSSFSNLSPDHFSRVFYKKHKMRPVKYIQSKRIERAQLLLLTTDYTIKQIAYKVGLENLSNFSKIFKAVSGITPGAYRKNGRS
ncbi:helix-turn-helix domain-containing protein [Flavicella sediminum]|uniref:helix-turn-helix domain-containing protein n=1 Tax=Flavicella sediminum TaxID=2585141 RepID=UPI00111FD22F|nr:AraC family transcriptional regulator [Flavicella sediminum]